MLVRKPLIGGLKVTIPSFPYTYWDIPDRASVNPYVADRDGSAPDKNKSIKEPIIDISRIKKEFNFKAKKDLINSLDQLITNYKNYA